MDLVSLILKSSTLTVLAIECASVLFRMRVYNDKREARLFLSVLLLLMVQTILPPLPYLPELLTLLLLFTLKAYHVLIIRFHRNQLYNFALAAVFLIMLTLIPLHLYNTVSYALFFTFAGTFLAVPVFLLMWRLYRKLEKASIVVILATAVFFCLARQVEQVAGLWLPVPALIGDIGLLCLVLAVAWLLFEEEYFIAGSLRLISSGLVEEQRLALEMSARLATTEETLIAQDRLVASGVLAGGVSHEFKNIISLISNCAQYGLYQAAVEKKDESFRMIQDHVEHSMQSVIRVLDRLRKREHHQSQEIDIGDFLTRLSKIIRANYRPDGVSVLFDVRSSFRARVRPDDLEQIVLNLTRNAAAALLTRRDLPEKRISIVVIQSGAAGRIEIADNAGGIGEEDALRLFEQHGGPRQSSGLGLYLTRLLADQNRLTLGYRLLENGSIFSVDFSLIPAVIE